MKMKFILLFLFYSIIAFSQEQIERGITYQQLVDMKDTLVINILKVNLTDNNYKIEAIKADDKLFKRLKTIEIAQKLINRRINTHGSAFQKIVLIYFLLQLMEDENRVNV